MAQWRNRLALVKAEDTYGTNSTPSASDALMFTELDVTPVELELKERDTIQSVMGNRPSVVLKKSTPVKATVELAGSGVAGTAPRWGPMMKASGMSETVTAGTSVVYAPVNTGFSSYTMDFSADNGSRQAITGLRGSAEVKLTAEDTGTIAFDHMGIFNAPAALARPTETYTNQATPIAANSDTMPVVSVHGFNACMLEFSLSFGIEMVYHQRPGCTKQVKITNRKPTGSIKIELPTIQAKDFIAAAVAQDAAAITWTLNGPAGNIIAFSGPDCAFDTPTLDEADDITNITLPFRPLIQNFTFTLT